MKKLLTLCLVASFPGCALTTAQHERAVAHVAFGLASLQRAVDAACLYVSLKATGPEDAINKANWMDSAASGLRTIDTRSGGVVSPQLVREVLGQWTNPNAAHWEEFAETIVDAFSKTKEPPAVALETLAMKANKNAAALREVAVSELPK